MHKSSTSRF